MYRGDLFLQSAIHKPVPSQSCFLRKLGRNYNSFKHLAATSFKSVSLVASVYTMIAG
jgi:hypothetical protein